MWPPSLNDIEVVPSTPSLKPPGGSPRKQRGPVKRKTYNVSRRSARLNSHGSLTSVNSMTSEVSEKNNSQGHISTHNTTHGSTQDSDHSAYDVSILGRSTEKDHNESFSVRHDFDLQPDHKVKWRSFDIIEGVVSYETDYENTLNQMECDSKQLRQRKAKKRFKRNRLRKKFTYTFLRPKHYKPLIDDPDAIEEIRAIEEEFDRRRQEYVPLLQFNNRKFWKKLSRNSDLPNRVQCVAESLAEMKLGPTHTSQPVRLKPSGSKRLFE